MQIRGGGGVNWLITGEKAAKLVVNFKDVVCVFIIGWLINGE